MTDFQKALNFMLKWEGGYVNDPQDPGGETYKGISRKAHPQWPGWKVIDKANKSNLEKNTKLQKLVKDFYYNKYWLSTECDQLAFPVSISVFDCAVNCGIRNSMRFLQRSCNRILAISAGTDDSIKVDGIYGPQTANIIQMVDKPELASWHLLERIGHYVYLNNKYTWAQKFFTGWLNRVDALKQTFTKA